MRSGGPLLAARAVLVLLFARDPISLRDDLRGLQHAHVDGRLALDQPRILEHVPVQLLLDTGDRLESARNHHRNAVDDHALGGDRDGLQTGGTEAVHGRTRRGNRKTRAQRDLTGDVASRRAFRQRAPHDHVLDFGWIELRAVERGAVGVSAECRTVRHVESTAPGLRQPGASGGDDRCVLHGALPENDFPSAASFASRGADSQAALSPCGFCASRRMERTTL